MSCALANIFRELNAINKMLKHIRKVVFVRHGESVWNKSNRFTGWHDVPLSSAGIQESLDAGHKIKMSKILIDNVFTSNLKRTICCFDKIADVLDIHSIPVIKTYRLNERHYGALEGLNKAEMITKYGEAQVKLWTRSFNVRPPPLCDVNLGSPLTEVW